MAERIVVIGGNAAGMTAASRARRLDPGLEITILELSHFISYSICGLPYLISGEVADHNDLVVFTPERLKRERDIEARVRVRVEEILPGRRRLGCVEMDTGRGFEMEYDQAVISTGYLPRVPQIEGLELDRVLTVSRLEHGLRIRQETERARCRRVLIVGGGYIGLMMAHGLRTLGLEVTLVERNRHVYAQVDEDMAGLIEDELRRQGVHLCLGTRLERLLGKDGAFRGVELQGQLHEADLALIDVGVDPNTELARECGVALGLSGAIQVDSRGQASVPGVWAAGNCAETVHRVSGKPVFSALGTTAARQGRVVGENLAGRRSEFEGTLETSVEKVFDLSVARTGLTLREALECGFEAAASRVTARDRAGYYTGSGPLDVRLVFERPTGRLLGGQIVGTGGAAKRIDTLATALAAQLDLRQIAQLDLAYAPPYGTLWDPIQVAANVGMREVGR